MQDALNDLTVVEKTDGFAIYRNKFRSKYVIVRLNLRGEAVVRMATRSTLTAARNFVRHAS